MGTSATIIDISTNRGTRVSYDGHDDDCVGAGFMLRNHWNTQDRVNELLNNYNQTGGPSVPGGTALIFGDMLQLGPEIAECLNYDDGAEDEHFPGGMAYALQSYCSSDYTYIWTGERWLSNDEDHPEYNEKEFYELLDRLEQLGYQAGS